MPRNEMAQLARNVISKASENLGHLEFAKFIATELGGQVYDRNTVSGWRSGKVVPPADVLLAAAKLAKVDLTARLHQATLEAVVDRQGQEIERLRRIVEGGS